MAAGVTVDYTDLLLSMERLRHELPGIVGDSAYQAAQDVADRTRRIVPRRTGRLAASVRPVRSGDEARVEIGAPYARYVAWPAMNQAARGSDRIMAAYAETALDRLAVTLMNEPRYYYNTLNGNDQVDVQKTAGDKTEIGYDTRITVAIYWVLRRHEEPDFTFDEAMTIPLLTIQRQVVVGDDLPEVPGASNGAPPLSSVESGASVPVT